MKSKIYKLFDGGGQVDLSQIVGTTWQKLPADTSRYQLNVKLRNGLVFDSNSYPDWETTQKALAELNQAWEQYQEPFDTIVEFKHSSDCIDISKVVAFSVRWQSFGNGPKEWYVRAILSDTGYEYKSKRHISEDTAKEEWKLIHRKILEYKEYLNR